MSEKWTKGPWIVDFDLCDEEGPLDVPEVNGRILDQDNCVVCQASTEVNVFLIAAAPEMYEALKAIEWIKEKDGEPAFCPICRHYVHGGHSNECKLGAALKKSQR